MMKAETKAKRRVTLSICGLGVLDETEVENVPHQAPQVRQTNPPAIANGAHEPSDEEEVIRELAKELEDADTLQELAGAWDRVRADKRIGIEDKTKLAKLKDERKAMMQAVPA